MCRMVARAEAAPAAEALASAAAAAAAVAAAAVAPVAATPGGTPAARARLDAFVGQRLGGYADHRSQPRAPDEGNASGLSPYLHFGHISIEEVVERVLTTTGEWTPEELRVQRVQHVGAVQGHGRDVVFQLVDQLLVGHSGSRLLGLRAQLAEGCPYQVPHPDGITTSGARSRDRHWVRATVEVGERM